MEKRMLSDYGVIDKDLEWIENVIFVCIGLTFDVYHKGTTNQAIVVNEQKEVLYVCDHERITCEEEWPDD